MTVINPPDNKGKSLELMQSQVRAVNIKNGWYDDSRTFGDDIALLHSEVSECFEAYRRWGTEDTTRKECKDHQTYDPEFPDVHQPQWKSHICKPEGVGSELADILVRLLDTCERYHIDLEAEFNRKMEYNATRGYKHGNKLV